MDSFVTHGNRAPGGCWHYDPLSPLEAAMRFSRAEGERKPPPFDVRTTELDPGRLEALLDSGDAPHTTNTHAPHTTNTYQHTGPLIARARCGGKRYPGCLSVPLPPKSPGFDPRQSPPNRPVPHRQVRRCSGKAHSRARIAAAAALARSLDRAHSLWRWR